MLREFGKYFKGYRRYLVLGCLCIVFETMFELVIPLIMTDIIDIGVASNNQQIILEKGFLMVFCAVISLLLGMAYARLAAKAGQGFGAQLRQAEFAKIQNYSFHNMDNFSSSSLVTRLSGDVNVMQNAICNGIRPLLRSPVMLFTALILSFTLNKELAIIFLVAIPILGISLFFIVRKIGPLYNHMQVAVDRVNRIVQENLIAIRVVKSFVRMDYEKEKFQKVNEELQNTAQTAFHYGVLNMPIFQFVMYSTILAILFFGGNLILIGNMQVGALTGFLSYVMQVLNSLMMISNVFLMLTRSLASAARIHEVLNEESEIKDPIGSQEHIENGTIEFRHVFFKYQNEAEEHVLSDINLRILSGQTIGILGGTGSAKTSLVQLIPRLYDVSEGEVFIDGRNVKEYSLEHLRDSIGIVLQKNTLFSSTIKENLMWGNPRASDEELKWACGIACADEFVGQMKQGYESDLGQGGVNLSGGQKQRLCIARALLKRPKVLIFDDSTSAVDTATEALIREGIAKDLKDTTKIFIAQRISTVEHADQIIILEDGRINAIGTHKELLLNNAVYQEIYTSQMEGGGL